MNIKTKFRGKSVNNGKWFYGFLFEMSYDGYPVQCIGLEPLSANDYSEIYSSCYEEVIPETIGQFTELEDKNNIEIYKGDILKSDIGAKHTWVVLYDDGAYEISREMKKKKKKIHLHEKEILCKDNLVFYDLCVIGNIHDNPELLEVQDE